MEEEAQHELQQLLVFQEDFMEEAVQEETLGEIRHRATAAQGRPVS
jgi:hypothetical protein